jgi:hypothetical protein
LLPRKVVTEDDVELELEEDDLLPVESAPALPRPRPPAPPMRARAATIPPISRRAIDERVANDVAGECLASIAEVTSRHRIPLSVTPTTVPPPPLSRSEEHGVDVSLDELFDTAVRPPRASARLPAVTAPPFVRTPAHAAASSSRIPAATSSSAVTRGAPPPMERAPKASDAPVSVPVRAPEATVIVVREPPRTAWIVAAAVGGAILAVGGMRTLASSNDAPAPITTTAAAATPVVKDTPLVAPPPATVAPPERPPSGAVVSFTEPVAIKVPSPASSAPSTVPSATAKAQPQAQAPSKPKAPPPPKLPDGSYGLTRGDAPGKPAPAPTLAPPAPKSEPPKSEAASTSRPRALTPEQQLAEAQLRASMK